MRKKNVLLILISLVLLIWVIGLFISKRVEATIYGRIEGRVIAEDTGKGVRGVIVRLIQTEFRFEPKIWKVKTDSNGYFNFDMVKEGKYFLHFTPPAPYIEDMDFGRYLIKGKGDYPGQTIVVEKGKTIYFEKMVRVGGSISGTVYIKENGNISPYEGAFIVAYSEKESKSTHTKSNGQYKIGGLDPSFEYYITAQIKNGYAIKMKRNITISKNQDTSGIDFVFDLNDETSIEGTVTSSIDGKPIKGASVSILDDNFIWGSIDTDENGKFKIIGIAPGIYKVSVFPCGEYGIEKVITKENIYVEKGKTTIVNFEVDCFSN